MKTADIEGASRLENALNDNDMLPIEIIGIAVRGSIFSVLYDRNISFGFDMWTVDSAGQSFSMTIAGTAGEELDIEWGDGSSDSYIFTGSNQLIAHVYDPGQFLQRWDVNKLAITYLNVPNQNLVGDLPLAIQGFHGLTTLNVSSNNLTGDLSGWSVALANWGNIVNFYIQSNQFTGDLSGWSTALENWGNVVNVQIQSNNFTGDLSGWSAALANWGNVVIFYIQSNNFTGDLSGWSAALANWGNIANFYIQYNQFTGDLSGWSTALENWGSILAFQIQSNQFTGDLSGWSTALENWGNIVNVQIQFNIISSIGVDNCHIGLDGSGVVDGTAIIVSGNNPRTPASDEAYNSLIDKGWNLS